MDRKTIAILKTAENERSEPPPRRDEMRPARGLFVGLALSMIFWLGLFVLWLAV